MKGSRLHLDLFKVFVDLAECKSFARAAAMNALTQSAVSQQIAFLERHFGKRLIDRGKGRFSLTEEGTIFLDGCKKILEEYANTVNIMKGNSSSFVGSVKVETVYSVGLYEIPDYIRKFMKCCPQVHLQVEFNRSDWIYTNVLQGKCDLGIVAYPWHHRLISFQLFKTEKMVCVCHPKHPFTRLRKIELKHLDGQDFIAFNRNIPTGQAVHTLLRKHKIFVNIIHEFDNIETIKRSIEIGTGISILPDTTVQQEVRRRMLKVVPLKGVNLERSVGIIWDKRRTLPRAVRAFQNLLTRGSCSVPSE